MNTTMQAVRFDRYGGVDVLDVATVPRPTPAAGQVLVRVKAAGINPGETMIRSGALKDQFPATFPSGQGSDFAGIVEAVGADVTSFSAGDEVIGFTNDRASQAEFVAVAADQLTARPPRVPWEVAGSLFVAGTTAWAAVEAIDLSAADTVVVSAAAGGVGSIAVQLARRKGASVIGIAGPGNDDWLRSHGAIPVNHGPDLADRIRTASAGGLPSAMLDFFGDGYVRLAIEELGIAPDRVNTVIDFAAAKRFGVRTAGNHDGASAAVVEKLAALVAEGGLEVPIAGTFPLAGVRAAFRLLEERRTRGKIVLTP